MDRIKIPHLKQNDYKVNHFLRFHHVVLEVRNHNVEAFRALKHHLDTENLNPSMHGEDVPYYCRRFDLDSLFTFSQVPISGIQDNLSYWWDLEIEFREGGFYILIEESWFSERSSVRPCEPFFEEPIPTY